MDLIVHCQAIRSFDTPCGVYLRDEHGALAALDGDAQVEAVAYGGSHVQERWPASLSERGRLEWVVPAGTGLVRGLYQLRARSEGQLLALGLLEVV